MASILGMHCQGKPAHGQEAIASLCRRRSEDGPFEHTSALDIAVAAFLGESDKAPEQDALDPELEAEQMLQIHVSCKILFQHCASPGQGCATLCSIMTSTLA